MANQLQHGLDDPVNQSSPVEPVADNHHADNGHYSVATDAFEGILGVEETQFGKRSRPQAELQRSDPR